MPTPFISPRLTLKWLASHAKGTDIKVAVIDSGVDASHPALKGKVVGGAFVFKDKSDRIVIEETPPSKCHDEYGHGTAVAGIITDLAPKVKIYSVRVLDQYNACTGDVLIAGMKWALDKKIRLLNMSLCTSKPIWIPQIFDLCEQAFVQNSIIVAARRNFGDLGCPAMFSSVISVDRNECPEKLRIHHRPNDMIQFDARGTDIKVLAPGGGHAIQTGTSFATPNVCGIVALLLEIFPRMNAAEVKAALKAFSTETDKSK